MSEREIVRDIYRVRERERERKSERGSKRERVRESEKNQYIQCRRLFPSPLALKMRKEFLSFLKNIFSLFFFVI